MQINVVGAVIVRDGAVLSAQRGPGMSLPGKWEFPGGKIELGETPAQALGRELEEELLCTIDVGERVATTSYEYDFGVVTLTTFYATLVNGVPHLTEHSQIRWVSVDQLAGLDWAPADIPTVSQVIRDLTGHRF